MELASDVTPEDIEVFLQEADEHLSLLDEDIVRLEREPSNPDLLQEIFRAAHTLKGSSAMLGYRTMTELTHSMESLLDKLRKGDLEVNTEVIDALLLSLAVLVALKDGLVESKEPVVDLKSAVTKLDAASQTHDDAGDPGVAKDRAADEPLTLDGEASSRLRVLVEQGESAWLVKTTFHGESDWTAVRCFQILDALGAMGEVLATDPTRADIEGEDVGLSIQLVFAGRHEEDAIRQVVAAVEDVVDVEISPTGPAEAPAVVEAEVTTQTAGGSRAPQKAQTLRIDVDRLDMLMNMIGELVIDRTRIVEISRNLESKYRDDEMVQALGKTSAHIEKVVDELQESNMKVRMLPIGTVFNGFPRMIRDLAQKAGKKLDFVVEGQDTEIDRTVIERIRDPLVHLLRNALDHGLEPPDQRKAMGKPETAVVRLSAAHAEGYIVITVQDDGRGIDPKMIRESAANNGIVSPEMAARVSDSEAMDLIFMPGMSTAKKTTEVSGRGVGMDIVKANIEAINGFVNLDSTIGEGTTFTLKLPLILATVRALLVSLDDTVYAVPVVHVIEAVKLGAADIQTIDRKEVFRLREAVVPLLRLKSTLDGVTHDGRSQEFSDPEDSNGAETQLATAVAQRASATDTYVVVVRFGERLVGLGVDSLIELQEIVVKSVGNNAGAGTGIAGASILGDGQVVLILDVPTLIAAAVFRAA